MFPTQFDRLVRAGLFFALTFIILAPGAQARNEDAGGGIPAVLRKLDEIQQHLERNSTELEALQARVATLDANTTPCTLQRFRDGLCGPDNHPLDLTVSVCGSVGADGSFAMKYALSGSLEGQVGLGWKEAPDVHIVENFQTPPLIPIVTPTAPPIPLGAIMLPSEVAANLQAAAALGLDACINDIRIPIGKNISEPAVIALLEQLERTAEPLLTVLSDQLGGGQSAALLDTRAALQNASTGLETLENALSMVRDFADAELASTNTDPLDPFRNGQLRSLANTLPVGTRIQAILDDPGQMAIPAMADEQGLVAANATTSAGNINYTGVTGRLCAVLASPDSSLLSRIAPVCGFVEQVGDLLPSIDDLVELLSNINLIPDLPETLKAVLQPLFDGADEVIANTGNAFCNSRVGSRPLFDGLCGR